MLRDDDPDWHRVPGPAAGTSGGQGMTEPPSPEVRTAGTNQGLPYLPDLSFLEGTMRYLGSDRVAAKVQIRC
jgi:hypothetical protein